MAKKKKRSSGDGGTRTQVVRYAPAYAGSPVVVSRGQAVKRYAKRAGRAAIKPLGLFGGGAAYGYAEAEGWLNAVPTLGDLPQSSSLALAVAFTGGVNSRNEYIRDASVAAVVIGGFDIGRYFSQRSKEKKEKDEKKK